MKIRNGFVSNSSSSSFCIFGVEITNEMLEAAGITEGYDNGYELAKKFDLEFEFGPPGRSDHGYIGRSWSSIKDDETGLSFKQSVINKLEKVCNNIDIKYYTFEEGWYDG